MDEYLNEMRDRAFMAGLEAADKKGQVFKTVVLHRRIAAFEKAVREHAFKGAHLPEDHALLEQRLEKKRKALLSYILEHTL